MRPCVLFLDVASSTYTVKASRTSHSPEWAVNVCRSEICRTVCGHVWGGAATLVLAGCFARSDATDSRAGVYDDGVNARTDPTATLAPTDGSTFVDADGRTWSVRKVTSFAADTSDSTPSFHATSYPTKSDDQIADDFRAVRLKLGADGDAWEYTEVYPPTARVTAALAKDRAGVSGYGTIGPNGEHTYVEEAPATSAMQPIRPGDYGAIGSDDAIRRPVATRQFSVERWTSRRAPASVGRTPFTELTPTSEQGTEVLPDLQEAAPRNVIGNEDDRVWMTHEGIASSQGKVEISVSSDPYPGVPGSHCSAHPIGRATAISAAHGFLAAVLEHVGQPQGLGGRGRPQQQRSRVSRNDPVRSVVPLLLGHDPLGVDHAVRCCRRLGCHRFRKHRVQHRVARRRRWMDRVLGRRGSDGDD